MESLNKLAVCTVNREALKRDVVKESIERGYIIVDDETPEEVISRYNATLNINAYNTNPYIDGETIWDELDEREKSIHYRDSVLDKKINRVSGEYAEPKMVDRYSLCGLVEEKLFLNETDYGLTQENVQILTEEILEKNDFDKFIKDKVDEHIDGLEEGREDLLIDPIRFE